AVVAFATVGAQLTMQGQSSRHRHLQRAATGASFAEADAAGVVGSAATAAEGDGSERIAKRRRADAGRRRRVPTAPAVCATRAAGGIGIATAMGGTAAGQTLPRR